MFFRTTSSVLAVLALSAPAFADITPAEVWQSWVDYYKANGYTVTEGSREQAGETLSLKNVVLAFQGTGRQGSVTLTAPQVTLISTGDGKVRTTYSDSMPVTLTTSDADGKPLTVTATLTQKDAEVVSSGTSGDITHDARAVEVALKGDTVTTADGDMPVVFSVKVSNFRAQEHMVDGAMSRADGSMSAERMDLAAEFDEKGEKPSHAVMTGHLSALSGKGDLTLPKGVNAGKDINAALKAGLDVTGGVSAEDGAFDVVVTGTASDDTGAKADDKAKAASNDKAASDPAMTAKVTVKGFDVNVDMSADGLKYQTSVDAMTTDMAAPDMPFPISYAMESATGDLQVPVMKSDRPAPFKFAYSIAGLTLGDGLWNSFDPGKKLPRDPASLDVDLTGMVKVQMDLLDPANMEAAEQAAAGTGGATDPEAAADEADAADGAGSAQDGGAAAEPTPTPFVPTEIVINKLALSAVGARLDASGNLSAPEGGAAVEPVGKVSARLDGINGLLDKLVAMQVIPADQIGGLRMMLAMFTKAAPQGGDALTSEFEFKDGGQIFANGQQIK